jgi:hypothetical protein
MRGASRTAEGVKALLAKFTSSSRISLCRAHAEGRNGRHNRRIYRGTLCGVSAYLINNASWNSCAESTVPFTVDRRAESHAPVSFPLQIVPLLFAIIGRRIVASVIMSNLIPLLQLCLSALHGC